MAQSTRGYYEVGDYMVGKQIGAGSFSTVWHARHRVHGTEVAIKEIVTARLSPKLQESLKSEIFILKRVNHPNIIRLHDMIENLLLSTDGDNCILKIADFGFASLTSAAQKTPFPSARSLQPRGLAETLCGSPLYMAPEIMQLQKYDAKADLWSVGAILYQLVTGRTPFTGSNQIHLLQNIIRSTGLQFPPEAKDLSPHCMDLCKKLLQRNPVERLTFEEFFNHPYLSQREPDESIRQSGRVLGGFPPAESNTEETLKEDCLPFSLHNDSSSPRGSTSFHSRCTMKSMYELSLDSKPDQRDIPILADKTASSKYSHAPHKTEITGSSLGSRCLSEGNLRESLKNTGLGLLDNQSKVMDSLESIVQDYVIVSGPLLDLSSLAHASKPSHFLSRSGSPPLYSGNMNSKPSTSEPIISETGRVDNTGIIEHRLSVSGISQGSMDIAETLEQPSTDCMTRISSLQRSAAAITELVNDKIEGGKHLEAFSVQLIVLAIWKKALHICHTHAASAIEGSPSHQRRFREVSKVQYSPDSQKSHDLANAQGQLNIYSEIERAFLHEVGHAEELAELIEPGNMEMPDAMELIYQSALALGRRGAVDEYMGDVETAVVFYSKAVRLLLFLLKEAPCLIVNPPFSLTNSDRYRIQNYIDVLNNRQSISRSQRMVVLKAEDQSCTS
ncbi:UNVERIFIED_CONTAM: Serine/threonine-protein kinase ATG1c [Sesamum angustifolium]|uniref:Serine/threonine-protein kinase ATG1c n=1 Tax=Sesamum angustifolium TaxID=2727405 RepID=A0AAW2N474_9LAMI